MRTAAHEDHPPPAVFLLLATLSLLAAVLAIALWLIIDLEAPRYGLIRIDSADHLLRDVRASMGVPTR